MTDRNRRGGGSVAMRRIPRGRNHRGDSTEIRSASCNGREQRRGYTSRSRGHSVGRSSRRHVDTAIDLAKNLQSLKLIPERKEESVDCTLEEIDIYLTDEELRLPEGLRKLRSVLKKCANIKRCDVISMELLQDLLESTRDEVPLVQSGLEDVVYLMGEIDNPSNFFLQLKAQKDRQNLINCFLTHMVRFEKLQEVDVGTCEPGQLVTVEPSGWQTYVRGRIERRASVKGVQVYLIDYGSTHNLDLRSSSVYELPSCVSREASLSFGAYLCGLSQRPDSEIQDMRHIFKAELHDKTILRCSIEESSFRNGEKIFGVHLKKVSEHGCVDIAELLIKLAAEDAATNSMHDMVTRSNISLKDLSLLLHTDNEVNILPYAEDDHRVLKQLRALQIVSPGEMIVYHMSNYEKQPPWYIEMQKFYRDKDRSASYAIRTESIFPNRCYVWHDGKNNSWNRVRVIRLLDTYNGKDAMVWLLDRGEAVAANKRDMMEINPIFCMSCALAFRAHLAHVKPIDSSNEWSSKSIEAVKAFTNGRILEAIVVETSSLDFDNSDVLLMVSFGLVVAKKDPPYLGTLQAELVKKTLVCPSGPCSGRHDLAFRLTGRPYYSRNDFVQYLKLGAGREVSGMSSEEIVRMPVKDILAVFKVKEIPKKAFSVSLRRDWRSVPEDPPHSSLQTSALGKVNKLNISDHIPEAMQVRMGYVNISSEGTGPGNFYIQMQERWDEFDRMMEDLQEVAKMMPMLHPRSIKPGMLAIATALEEGKFGAWGRVVVASVNPAANLYSVIFIDFGFELDASLSGIRYLPQYLNSIPPFCHRAHLDFTSDDNLLMPAGVNWQVAADTAWKRMIVEWNEVSPIYYAWEIRPGTDDGIIQLEEFNQKLNFNRATRRWGPGPLAQTRAYEAVSKLREHPLLKQFFSSIGINIAYEKEDFTRKLTFVPIWKHLQDAGLIVPLVEASKNPFCAYSQSKLA